MNGTSYSIEKIKSSLTGAAGEAELYIFDSIDSTNSYAKTLVNPENKKSAVVISNGQTGGRGTRGRSFISRDGGGLYISILFYPKKGVSPADITVYAALKAAESVEALAPIDVKIKWVNDLYVNGKKLAGILTEGEISDSLLKYAIVGIGINTHGYTLDPEIDNIATTVEKECNLKISRENLAVELINRFFASLSDLGSAGVISQYRSRSLLTGKRVHVASAEGDFDATVIEICDTGAIVVEKNDGKRVELISGDVSLRL